MSRVDMTRNKRLSWLVVNCASNDLILSTRRKARAFRCDSTSAVKGLNEY